MFQHSRQQGFSPGPFSTGLRSRLNPDSSIPVLKAFLSKTVSQIPPHLVTTLIYFLIWVAECNPKSEGARGSSPENALANSTGTGELSNQKEDRLSLCSAIIFIHAAYTYS